MSSAPATDTPLEFLEIAGILKDLFQKRATGELSLSAGETKKKIFFKNGVIIFALSNLEHDRLGDILLEHGVISRAQFDESAKQVAETGKKQGTVLVQMGALTPKDLFRGLSLQVREIILSVFGWEEGSWHFSDILPAQDEIVTLRIQPSLVILEGVVRRAARKDLFQQRWNPGMMKIAPHPDPPWPIEDLRLPPEARKILTHVERGNSWSTIPRVVGLSSEDAAAFLFTLSALDLVTVSEPGGPPREVSDPAAAEEAAVEESGAALPTPERIEELAGKISSLNLYQVLRLNPTAGQETIKSSYLMLAKEYHPDRFFGEVYDACRDRITLIFMKVNEAYTVLGDPGKRAEYDRVEQDSRVAKEQYRKGMELLKAGDPWAASESFRWAVHLNPRSALFHTWLGASLARTRKRLHEAEEHCKTAITLDYSNPLFYVHLGQVYLAGRLNEKARKQFETALKLDPGYSEAREALDVMKGGDQDRGLFDKLFRK